MTPLTQRTDRELCRRSAAAGSCEWRAMAAMDVDGGIGGGLSKSWMSDLSKPILSARSTAWSGAGWTWEEMTR
jgi:hypothetical protein